MAKKTPTSIRKTAPVVSVSNATPQNIGINIPSFWKQNLYPALILAGIAVVLYIYSIKFDYVLDDQIVITNNRFVKTGTAGISDIMGKETFVGYFGEQRDLVAGSRYRPLSLVLFALETQWFGQKTLNEKGQTLQDEKRRLLYTPNSVAHHFFNVFWYMLSGLLLFRVLSLLFPTERKNNDDDIKEKTTNQWWFSLPFIATLLFVAHPTHSEAVANVKGRDEIMTFIGVFAALYYVLRYADSNKQIYLLLSGVVFFLGLLSKENAITFLAIIPMTLYFFRNATIQKMLVATVPAFIATIIYLLMRYKAIGYVFSSGKEITDIMNNPFYGMSANERFSTIFYTLGQYIKLLFFPHPLTHDYYPYQIPILNFGDIRAIWGLALNVVIAALGLWGLRKKAVWAYGILFYFITLSIVSNIPVSVGTFMNERFIYLPSVGFCIALSYFLLEILPALFPNIDKNLGNKMALGIAGIFAVGFFAKTLERVPAWENTLSLNQAAIQISTNSARANLFMSTALFEKGKPETDDAKRKALMYEASPYVDKAVQILPSYGSAWHMKSGIDAEIFRYDKDIDKLLNSFELALPYRDKLTITDAKNKDVFIDQYVRYLNGKPEYKDKMLAFYRKIAYPLFGEQQKDYTNALRYINYGLSLDPNDAQLKADLAKVQAMQQGK
jgi:protein O-mannosyl-transferase